MNPLKRQVRLLTPSLVIRESTGPVDPTATAGVVVAGVAAGDLGGL